MKSILILEDSSIYDYGGGQRITLEVISCLKTHNAYLFLYDLGAGSQFSSLVRECDVESRHLGVKSIPHFFYKLPQVIYETVNIINKKNIVCLYPTTKKALLVSAIIKIIKRKIIVVFHQHSRLGYIFEPLKMFADTVIVPGKIEDGYNKKTFEVSNPVNIVRTKFKTKVESDKKIVIGFIGNLTKNKGFDIFIQTQNINKMTAIVAGKGPLEGLMENADNIDYLGYVEDHKKEEFYNNIDIFVFPSIVDETFSLACFEAMFNYNPVVCFDLGYPSKIIKNYHVGVIAKSQTIESLNVAIQECILHINELSDNCNKVIEDYDNDDFCKNLVSVFQKN